MKIVETKFKLSEANSTEGNEFVKNIIIKNTQKLGFELDKLDDNNRLYFKGISSKGQRDTRIDLLNSIESLFPNNEFINLTKETPTFSVVINGKTHKFYIKGAGSDFGTSTPQKEGLVIFFYNSPLTELLTPESLLKNGEKILGGDYYEGMDSKGKGTSKKNLLVNISQTLKKPLIIKQL